MRRVRRILAAATLTTLAVASSLSAGSVSAAPDDEVIEGIIDATGPSSGSVPEVTLVTAVPLPVDPAPTTANEVEAHDDTQPTLVTAVPLPIDPLPVSEEPEAPSTITAINGPAGVSTATTTTTIPEPEPAARNSVGGTVFVDFNRNGADDGSAADPRAAGVGIIVLWDGADGQPGTGDDQVFETITDGNGAYRLGGLHDGGYTVAINPVMIPADATVTIDPDGGLADATSVISLSGGAANMSQNFGLGTRPPDLEDAAVVADPASAVVVSATSSDASGFAPQSSNGGATAQAAADEGPLLPATGRDEAVVSLYIALALLLSGLALMAIRGRGSNITG